MENGLSPEEILRMKEIEGGIEYDDPISKEMFLEELHAEIAFQLNQFRQ